MLDTQNNKTDVLRDKNGRWLVAPKSPAPITHENARSMVQKRWDNYRRAAVKRIVDEAKSVDLSVSTGADAFGLVAAKQYTALMDSDKPKLDDLERLQKMMTGMVANSQRENVDALPGAVIAAPETLLRLIELLEADKAAAVERARAIDAESIDTRNE
jgi:hypothetical protein